MKRAPVVPRLELSSGRRDTHLKTLPENNFPLYVDMINRRPRMTFDIECETLSDLDDTFRKLKEIILQERAANNKAYHLRIKEQDDMINQLKKQVYDARLTERSMASSRFTVASSSCSIEPDTQGIDRKLAALEKTFINHKKTERISLRTRVFKSNKSQFYNASNPNDYSKVRETFLTPQQQLAVSRLADKHSSIIFAADNNLKRLVEGVQQANNEQQRLREAYAKNSQMVESLKMQLQLLEVDHICSKNELDRANQRYQQIQKDIREMIERERRKFFFEAKCVQTTEGHRISL